MNKKEFINFHAKSKKIQSSEAEEQVNGLLDSLTSALSQDGSETDRYDELLR